ncbi:MAG: single-stranded DNA-binding protein [Lachnospirales bacterium]
MNKVILIGRLARDPEVRYTQSAEPLAITRFAVAVDRPFSRNNGENEKTVDFLNCVCFGKRGETIGQYFKKGNRIAVTGRIQTGEYTDKSGNKRYTTDIVVEDFEFVESKAEREAGMGSAPSFNNVSSPAPQQANSQPEGFYSIDDSTDDEDLPF